jgi:hypothetical protein
MSGRPISSLAGSLNLISRRNPAVLTVRLLPAAHQCPATTRPAFAPCRTRAAEYL